MVSLNVNESGGNYSALSDLAEGRQFEYDFTECEILLPNHFQAL